MELKVCVDGIVRVVCGLSLNTSCQEVVIALAQAIGQTGRYVLVLKLRGTERQLLADECPLQSLAQLGQLAAEVQFLLQRTGPSHAGGLYSSSTERLPLYRPPESKPQKTREPQKAFTFNLGPSTFPRIPKPNRAWSPSPRASPEPRESLSILDPSDSFSSKEEVFRQLVEQQRKLYELDIQLQALERETEMWEQERSLTPVPSLTVVSAEELDDLQQRLRQNEAVLVHGEQWEVQLQAELNREQDMQRRLHKISSLIDDHSFHITEHQARSAYLEEDIELTVQRQRSVVGTRQADKILKPLKQELGYRLKQAEELDTALLETQAELQAAEHSLQDRCNIFEELNKELRQRKLQQFIHQTSSPPADQTRSLPADQTRSLPAKNVYLNNAGIVE
ncbi:uncharacterized protein V6R79_017768 [Siganus canaliculatus]